MISTVSLHQCQPQEIFPVLPKNFLKPEEFLKDLSIFSMSDNAFGDVGFGFVENLSSKIRHWAQEFSTKCFLRDQEQQSIWHGVKGSSRKYSLLDTKTVSVRTRGGGKEGDEEKASGEKPQKSEPAQPQPQPQAQSEAPEEQPAQPQAQSAAAAAAGLPGEEEEAKDRLKQQPVQEQKATRTINKVIATCNFTDESKKEALLVAISSGSLRVVRALVEQKTLDESLAGIAIQHAAKEGKLSILQFLLSQETEISKYFAGMALVDAARYGHTEIVIALLESSLDIAQKYRVSALIFAFMNENYSSMEALLSDGTLLEPATEYANTQAKIGEGLLRWLSNYKAS